MRCEANGDEKGDVETRAHFLCAGLICEGKGDGLTGVEVVVDRSLGCRNQNKVEATLR